jgi:hypothetical protein
MYCYSISPNVAASAVTSCWLPAFLRGSILLVLLNAGCSGETPNLVGDQQPVAEARAAETDTEPVASEKLLVSKAPLDPQKLWALQTLQAAIDRWSWRSDQDRVEAQEQDIEQIAKMAVQVAGADGLPVLYRLLRLLESSERPVNRAVVYELLAHAVGSHDDSLKDFFSGELSRRGDRRFRPR